MEKLNTHEGLYGLLVRGLDQFDAAAARSSTLSGMPALPAPPLGQQAEQGCVEGYTEEAVRVGRSLRRDFEKAGIHLPGPQRDRLVELTGLERHLGIAIGCCPALHHASLDRFEVIPVVLAKPPTWCTNSVWCAACMHNRGACHARLTSGVGQAP